jgi:hypothetical protein
MHRPPAQQAEEQQATAGLGQLGAEQLEELCLLLLQLDRTEQRLASNHLLSQQHFYCNYQSTVRQNNVIRLNNVKHW